MNNTDYRLVYTAKIPDDDSECRSDTCRICNMYGYTGIVPEEYFLEMKRALEMLNEIAPGRFGVGWLEYTNRCLAECAKIELPNDTDT